MRLCCHTNALRFGRGLITFSLSTKKQPDLLWQHLIMDNFNKDDDYFLTTWLWDVGIGYRFHDWYRWSGRRSWGSRHPTDNTSSRWWSCRIPFSVIDTTFGRTSCDEWFHDERWLRAKCHCQSFETYIPNIRKLVYIADLYKRNYSYSNSKRYENLMCKDETPSMMNTIFKAAAHSRSVILNQLTINILSPTRARQLTTSRGTMDLEQKTVGQHWANIKSWQSIAGAWVWFLTY